MRRPSNRPGRAGIGKFRDQFFHNPNQYWVGYFRVADIFAEGQPNRHGPLSSACLAAYTSVLRMHCNLKINLKPILCMHYSLKIIISCMHYSLNLISCNVLPFCSVAFLFFFLFSRSKLKNWLTPPYPRVSEEPPRFVCWWNRLISGQTRCVWKTKLQSVTDIYIYVIDFSKS